MRRLYSLLLLLALLLPTLLAAPPAAAQGPGDYAILGGRFFTQTAHGGGGFSVVDDGGARFWSEFQRLGLQNVGYPISRRFLYEGFVTQAFQKLVLQWRPEVGQAWPVNVFDELTYGGFNNRLYVERQTPYPIPNFDPPGATWDQIVRNRQALLNDNSAIRARYFSVRDPLNTLGLPLSRVEDMGNHYALRTQRAVFQQWKEDVPWARRGMVTVANGGDIGKELGWLTGGAMVPQTGPGDIDPVPPLPTLATWTTFDMEIDGSGPHVLYALQQRAVQPPGTGGTQTEYRLLQSDDLGSSWYNFGGGLPPVPGAGYIEHLATDPAVTGSLYAKSSDGFYQWTGNAWQKLATEGWEVTPGNPNQLWSLGSATIYRSDDRGATWVEAASGMNGGTMGLGTPGAIIVTPGNPPLAYAMLGVGRSGTTILRATPGGNWTALLPEPQPLQGHHYQVELLRGTGELYLGTTISKQIWRIPNPAAPVEAVRWEQLHTVTSVPRANMHLLAVTSGGSGRGPVLFANFHNNMGEASITYRSLDGGAMWQPVAFP